MKRILNAPSIYQFFQETGGFFGARLIALRDYLPINVGWRVIDIGCGPGTIVQHLPDGIDYFGFDVDERYIAYAKKNFGDRGKFFCQLFDDVSAQQFGPADMIMMNGVIHHLSDEAALSTLRTIRKALKPEGVLFNHDPCFREGQPWIARWLAQNDRGEFIRTEKQYRELLETTFDEVSTHIREDLARVPYTFLIGLSRQS